MSGCSSSSGSKGAAKKASGGGVSNVYDAIKSVGLDDRISKLPGTNRYQDFSMWVRNGDQFAETSKIKNVYLGDGVAVLNTGSEVVYAFGYRPLGGKNPMNDQPNIVMRLDKPVGKIVGLKTTNSGFIYLDEKSMP